MARFIAVVDAQTSATARINVDKIVAFWPSASGREDQADILLDGHTRPLPVRHSADQIEDLVRDAGSAPAGWTVRPRTPE